MRLRNYTAGVRLKEEEVLGPNFLGRALEIIGAMRPLVSSPLPLPHPPTFVVVSTHTSFVLSRVAPLRRQGELGPRLELTSLQHDVCLCPNQWSPMSKPAFEIDAVWLLYHARADHWRHCLTRLFQGLPADFDKGHVSQQRCHAGLQ